MVRNNIRRTFGLWITICVGLIIIGYGYFEARNIISGPKIALTSPVNGTETSEPLIDIAGTAKNIAFISLNDRQIYIDEQGAFKEPFLLSPGYNIVRINAKDKFGRTTEKIIEIVYKEATL